MRYKIGILLPVLFFFLSGISPAQTFLKDSLQTSLGFTISAGMLRDPGLNITSVLQSYNPSYNIKYRKVELGLGADYYRFSWRTPDSSNFNNIYSFAAYLRRYFFKREILYAELFLNTGYWQVGGNFEIYEADKFISTAGIGAGLIIPPLKRFREKPFLKNLYGVINCRESLLHRDISILKADVNVGLIYKL